MMSTNNFTPTEKKLYELLGDGKLHLIPDLIEVCIEDDLASIGNLRAHISNLRRKLPAGLLILFSRNRS